MKTTVTMLLALTALSALPRLAHSHEQHAHQSYAAGEPGDPERPSRTIEVGMSEMAYAAARIEVKQGEQIRFVIRNTGADNHEFLLATTAENLKHAKAMMENPDMAHDEPNGVRLAPAKSAEILWKFTQAGTFEYSCLIPGYREAGMISQILVK